MPRISSRADLPSPTRKQRIGLYGGSFDPVHSGHMHVAKTALKQLKLDQVWWLPSPGNPLKKAPGAYEQRFAAVSRLIANHPSMVASRVERRSQIRYTIDLVRMAKQYCRQTDLVWIMGSDNLQTLDRWKDWAEIVNLLPIAIIARPGHLIGGRRTPLANKFKSAQIPQNQAARLPSLKPPAWTVISNRLNYETSTQKRNASDGS